MNFLPQIERRCNTFFALLARYLFPVGLHSSNSNWSEHSNQILHHPDLSYFYSRIKSIINSFHFQLWHRLIQPSIKTTMTPPYFMVQTDKLLPMKNLHSFSQISQVIRMSIMMTLSKWFFLPSILLNMILTVSIFFLQW